MSPALTMLNGCFLLVAAGAGAGTVAFIEGVYSGNLDANVSKVYQASIKAVKSSGYTLTTHTLGDDKATITAETKTTSGITNATTTIRISIEKLTNTASKVSIRFGTFGDKASSTALMKKIQSKLSFF